MSDFERLESGELNGKQYFQQLEDQYVADGTLYRDEFNILRRSESAPPLSALPGHELPKKLSAEDIEKVDRFLKMPPIYFDED